MMDFHLLYLEVCGQSNRCLLKVENIYQTHVSGFSSLRAGNDSTPEVRGGADKSLDRPERKKLQRSNSGFIQHAPHEAECTS